MLHRKRLLTLKRLVLLTAVAAVFLLLSGRVDASTPESEPVSYRVQAGDTLWDIAETVASPGVDVRIVVRDIKILNDLTQSSLQQGQVLMLPAT